MIEALVGISAGLATIVLARIVRGQRWIYSIGLLVLPTLYILFALRTGEAALIAEEGLYGVPFFVGGLLFAFVGIRHSAAMVGALWMLHGLYDLVHPRLFANPGVPDWYPVWCGSVDVVVGAYVLWISRRIVGADLRRAENATDSDTAATPA